MTPDCVACWEVSHAWLTVRHYCDEHSELLTAKAPSSGQSPSEGT